MEKNIIICNAIRCNVTEVELHNFFKHNSTIIPHNINKVLNYCKKEPSRLHGPWTFGVQKVQNNERDTEYMKTVGLAKMKKFEEISDEHRLKDEGNIQKIANGNCEYDIETLKKINNYWLFEKSRYKF